MIGGGSVFRIDDVRVTRGFEIDCDLREPNNIQVNLAGQQVPHDGTYIGGLHSQHRCRSGAPPQSSPFDTFKGTGTGKLNNQTGARIEFEFVDAGEPGTSDTALIKVFDSNNSLVLDVPGDPNVPGFLTFGNMQTHKDNKCLAP